MGAWHWDKVIWNPDLWPNHSKNTDDNSTNKTKLWTLKLNFLPERHCERLPSWIKEYAYMQRDGRIKWLSRSGSSTYSNGYRCSLSLCLHTPLFKSRIRSSKRLPGQALNHRRVSCFQFKNARAPPTPRWFRVHTLLHRRPLLTLRPEVSIFNNTLCFFFFLLQRPQ